jgi:hypothetical protein
MKKYFQKSYPHYFIPFQIICLVLVAVIVYSGTLDHTFHLDDKHNIWNNSFIQISSLSLDELKKAAFESANHDRPVANISFALNYYINGLEVRGYHAVNIIIHLLAGIFLFYFVRIIFNVPLIKNKYGESGLIPFFAALIWLAHPLHIQSVTYIVQRMNSMAAMFFIMAMLFYVKARLSPQKTIKIIFLSLTFVSGLLAFGTKQNTVTLPLFILLFEWFFFQDLQVRISKKQLLWLVAIGLVFVFVLYLFLGASPLTKLTSGYSGRPFTLAQRLLTQPRVVLHYISLVIFPFPGRLNLDYDFPLSYSLVSPVITLFSILLLITIFGFGIYLLKKNRLYSFCIFWFLGNLVIESSVIPLEIIFEHRIYLPSMMAILLFVLLLRHTFSNKKMLMVSGISLTLIFTFWTYERNKTWKDESTLWADIHNKSPNKWRVNQHFGVLLSDSNRVAEAIPILEKTLKLYEQDIKFQKNVSRRQTSFHLQNLGIAYRKNGEYEKAIFYLNRALKEFYFSAKTHYQLGKCYIQIGRLGEAVFHLSKALDFAKHHRTDLDMQANVTNINLWLTKARNLLKQKNESE